MFLMAMDGIGPVVQALGWALVHFLWQGVAIGGLFAGGRFLLRHARPQARYLLGLACMLLLLLAPFITFLALFEHQAARATAIALPAAASVVTTAPAGLDVGAWIEQALPWVVLAWLAGVILMSGRVTLNWLRLYRSLRVGVQDLDDQLQAQVELLRHYFGIRRKVRVLESALAQVPTVFGWLKPVVLLPTSSLIGLTPAQLELVIAHEFGHIRRLDYLVNLFQITIETLLFYHPVVAWISRHVRHEREQCCDDLVVKTCGNRIEYARALTTLETLRSNGGLMPALAATDGQLLKRIERIVCTHGRPRDSVLSSSGALLVIAVVVILAGRMTDPVAAFEARRNLLADSLVSQLRIGDDADELFAPLENARIAPSAAVPEPSAAAQTAAPVRAAAADRAPAIRRSAPPEAVPVVADPPAARRPPAVILAQAPEPPAPVEDAEPEAVFEPAETSAPGRLSLDLANQPRYPDFTGPARPGPVAVKRVSPEYPFHARMAGEQGFVVVEFGVRPDGRVRDVRVTDSWPGRVFHRAAIRAIRNWRFDPATLADTSELRLTQRFDFNFDRASLEARDKRNCQPVTGTRICRSDGPASPPES